MRNIILVGVLLWLCSMEVMGQTPYIKVIDLLDYQPVSTVKVLCMGEGDGVLARGETDQNGKYTLAIEETRIKRVIFQHPDFEELEQTIEEIQGQGYQVFLEAKSYLADEVVFTASKFKEKREDVAVQIEVIKPREIAFRNPQSSADLLLQTGKVFVQKSQMGGGSPNLRGFEANKVMIVVDGVRMNNAIYRGGHLQNVITIDPNMVDRTEVVFGPASVIYGSDALGGVMHFYSKSPALSTEEEPLLRANAFVRFATVNNEDTEHLDLNLGFKRLGFLWSLTASNFDDLRSGRWHADSTTHLWKRPYYQSVIAGIDTLLLNEKDHIQVGSGYRQYDLMQKVKFMQNERLIHNLTFQFSTSSDVPRYDRLTQAETNAIWQPGGGEQIKFAEWNYGPQRRVFGSYSLNSYQETGIYDQANLTLGFQDLEESRINRRFGNNSRKLRTEGVQIWSVNADATKKLGKIHELAYGGEFAWNDVESSAYTEDIISGETADLDTRYPDGGSHMRWLAAYLSHKWKLAEGLSLNEGLRFTDVALESNFANKQFYPFLPDQIKQQNRALSGNLGLVWQPGSGWRMALLGSTGFRVPNVDDVGKVFDSSPGNVIVPNADIKPEHTYNGELTLGKRLSEKFRIEATGFYTFFNNALVVRDFQVEGQDSILYEGVLSKVQANVNAKQAQLYGFSANAIWQMNKQLRLTTTMSKTIGTDLSGDVPLDHIPPMFGRTSLHYQDKGLELEFFSMYNGWKRLEDYSPSGEDNLKYATVNGTPGWYTLNLRTSYMLSPQIKVQLGFENILDRHYRLFASGISAPGRNLVVALRANL